MDAHHSNPLAIADMAGESAQPEDLLTRVGHMTRLLHDSLSALGFDKLIQKVAEKEIPDARDRLNYVAKMTEQAAQRVLNATDAASPLQDGIDEGAVKLAEGWKVALDGPFSEKQYRILAARTLFNLTQTRESAQDTKQHLLDIMMAQDFQDLTGQVIKKVTELAQNLEQQLVQLLIDYAPAEMKRDAGSGLLNGPQINPGVTTDVVSNHEKVDDFLERLGIRTR